MKTTVNDLPGLDCGVCGFRTCAELAVRLETEPQMLKRCIHLSTSHLTAPEKTAIPAATRQAAIVAATPRGVTERFHFGRAQGRPDANPLDDIDRRIITLLLEDGRMSGAALARAAGVSQRTVRYRVERLLGSGVIQIGVVVNLHAVGLDVIADIFLEVAPGQVRNVAERFAALPEVSFVAGSIGNGDLSIQVCLHDNDELRRFVDEVVGQMPGVTRARTVLVPWKLKDIHRWNIPPSSTDEDEMRGQGDLRRDR